MRKKDEGQLGNDGRRRRGQVNEGRFCKCSEDARSALLEARCLGSHVLSGHGP